jgi:steroid delta-isomerase-like uncharacterized protein
MVTAETIHRQMCDAWNRRDFDAVRSLLHPEYTYMGGDGKELTGGPDTGVNVAKAYAAAFPDGRLEISATYAQGNAAVSELRATGTHQGSLMGIAPTGKRVDFVLCNVVELRDGKVYREREYFDVLHMWEQLGVLKAPGHAS